MSGMRENRISIEINRPVSEVFSFTIDPRNTSKWAGGIKHEETNEWPVKVGSIYRNIDASDEVSEYTLVALEENKIFELFLKDKGYHVRYTYIPISENKSHMEYFEWVDAGVLDNPFTLEIMENLKKLLEK